ncbi:MAG: dUTP diphosphatase [Ignavibacteriales bacterium CG07_land_8_20_14_0_80_59_12]|nr:MAG: dUTP diphosphatase [Ignavibacteriales bacterium CG07_land_8_20_14_0_80_59_12]
MENQLSSHESPLRVSITRVRASSYDLPVPRYATEGSSGMDLCADCESPIVIPPKGIAVVPTGFRVSLPPGCEGQVRPRSGLARNHGVTVLNAPGTIDSDYRGEIQVILINHGEAPFRISRADRVAQLVIAPAVRIEWIESDTLDATKRGEGGFGHTGP